MRPKQNKKPEQKSTRKNKNNNNKSITSKASSLRKSIKLINFYPD